MVDIMNEPTEENGSEIFYPEKGSQSCSSSHHVVTVEREKTAMIVPVIMPNS
jgi:hypothetical protein